MKYFTSNKLQCLKYFKIHANVVRILHRTFKTYLVQSMCPLHTPHGTDIVPRYMCLRSHKEGYIPLLKDRGKALYLKI